MQAIIFLLISWFLSTAAAAADATTILNSPATSKPGCPAKCGNLTVPYPFGIGVGSGCGIGQWFELNCSTAFDPPRAFIGDIQVYEISDNQMRVSNVMAKQCYDGSGMLVQKNTASADITGTPFSYSDLNKYILVGCDEFSLVTSAGVHNFTSGCVSLCSTDRDPVEGSCSGTGCCKTSVPKGVKFYMAQLATLSNHTGVSSFNPCGYAFLGEEERFHFRGAADLSDPNFVDRIVNTVPIVLDWEIGNSSCVDHDVENSDEEYACKGNSHCIDSNTGYGGYRCRCNDGYEGNPYLDPGCTDIDECDVNGKSPCLSMAICKNLPGSYECSCPEGYFGNGTRDSYGCHRVPLSKMINLSIGLGVGIGSLLVFSTCFWLHKLFRRRANKKRKQKFFKRNGGLLLQQQTNESAMGKTKLFSARELDKATDNFNENRILGQGGQGTVYKGMLPDGQIVAIKKSKLLDEDQLEQFINEVVILSQINHRNVVKLLGCCLETPVPLLVYEFLPNGTLFDVIHDSNTDFPVSWNMRLKIAADIAGALAYLHSACSLPIYHRDIKSSNILLDEKYVVKVSDFGTSKSLTVDQTHVTTLVKGTFGYLDPEYFQSSQFTEKSDVYSFGVVLVELLTGQRAISTNKIEEERSLATRFLILMERDCLDEILDDQVLEQGKKEEVVAVARLAQRCLNLQGRMRPTMKEVATELESIKLSQMPVVLSVGDNGVEEGKMMMLSDLEYSWTTSGKITVASASLESRPLKLETL